MKSILKICKIASINDVNSVRGAVANNEGVIACEVNKEKSEVSIVYDDNFVKIDKIIESIEDLGFTVL